RPFMSLAEKTPPGRDRYVDFLRAFSICVVVLGHWLIAVVYVRDGEISGVNALHVIPGLWIATWLLQVMPLFFFVGGFANLVSLDSIGRRGGDYAQFIRSRVDRLLRPTAVYLGLWIPIAIGIDLFTGFSDEVQEMAFELLTRPLWFLGVYMIMIGLAPFMLKLHRRHGFAALAALAAGAVIVDVVQLSLEMPIVGALNYFFVWLFAHQLGFFYADGTLLKLGRRYFAAMALGGLAALVLLTTLGPYSSSMVGLVRERSNTNPPTICILVLTIWQVGLAMLLRDRFNRMLARTKTWAKVIALNAMIMTMFLWHQTAVLITVGLLYPLGFPQPEAGTAQWWLVRPLWVASLTMVLALLVLVFGRFERGVKPRSRPVPAGVPRA
ncbi:MAG TPA: acyltransferase, partial [Actinomycetota bacterium]|nr:acyltransferase [Actinomycetota bacterium]